VVARAYQEQAKKWFTSAMPATILEMCRVVVMLSEGMLSLNWLMTNITFQMRSSRSTRSTRMSRMLLPMRRRLEVLPPTLAIWYAQSAMITVTSRKHQVRT